MTIVYYASQQGHNRTETDHTAVSRCISQYYLFYQIIFKES